MAKPDIQFGLGPLLKQYRQNYHTRVQSGEPTPVKPPTVRSVVEKVTGYNRRQKTFQHDPFQSPSLAQPPRNHPLTIEEAVKTYKEIEEGQALPADPRRFLERTAEALKIEQGSKEWRALVEQFGIDALTRRIGSDYAKLVFRGGPIPRRESPTRRNPFTGEKEEKVSFTDDPEGSK